MSKPDAAQEQNKSAKNTGCDHPFRVTGDMCCNCGEWDTDVVAMRGRLREFEAQSERRRKLLEISDARVSRLSERLEEAESRAADLASVLGKVEAYMASESGPLYRLWENCDIGDYDDYQTEWEQTLFNVRDWKNGCVPAASVGGGTEWPEVLLYREVLAALNPDARQEEVAASGAEAERE